MIHKYDVTIRIMRESDFPTVVLDVKSTNLQAIKCYQKCGFRVVKELEDSSLLMEWELHSSRTLKK